MALTGLVMDEDNYKRRYHAKLPMPTNTTVYDETITNNATTVVQAKTEAVHTAKIMDYLLFAAAERETCDFILTVVEDTWVCELQETATFYTAMAPHELLDHLQTLCGGLHALDMLALKNEMQNYHLDMKGIPEYVNALEDAHKQSKRAGKPIKADKFLLIVTNAMLST